MTAPTHRQVSISWVMIGAMLLYHFGISQINYYLMLLVMLQIGKYGALFPDIDHNWQNVKEKTVPNWIINKLIHITGGRHRSWQTHSIDIVAVVTVVSCILPKFLFDMSKISLINKELLSIILLAFSLGWVSHLYADMLTHVGVKLFFWGKIKVSLVPKHLGKLKFNTGEEWEKFVFKATKLLNIPIGVICIIFPLLADGTLMGWVNSIQHLLQTNF